MPPVVRAVGSGDSPFSPPGFAAVQVGLNYICATAERFFAVGAVLGSMVQMLVREHSPPRVDNARVSCGAYLTPPSAMSHTWQASTLCSRVSPSALRGIHPLLSASPPLSLRAQTEQPSVRLLKHIIRCYLRLSDNPRAREALRQCLPEQLRDPNFTACLKVRNQPLTLAPAPLAPRCCWSWSWRWGSRALAWVTCMRASDRPPLS